MPGRLQRLPAAQDMEDLGARVAQALRIGDAVCLHGPLGAGKTTLARGLIRALTTPDEEVPSPTFTLVQAYDGPDFTVAHFDLYRLVRPEEAFELGLDEALDDGAAVIEWPERLGGSLPANRLDIELSAPPEGGRLARLTGHGDWTNRMEDLLR
ncbi:MAG: tRNA (adenosine(37)-N6)-threonylcarbamoyltransferase complex ATPase subunit type 1 TsaE [Caulobacteraceae bacterium]